jgi:hypothetical protein
MVNGATSLRQLAERLRLVGVGLGNFRDPGEGTEPSLFP